jgi:hypothetical protein
MTQTTASTCDCRRYDDDAIAELHRIADTSSRAGAMFTAAAALGSATDAERWPLVAVFVDALRTYGLSVVDFMELLECAAAEVAAD